MAMYREIVMNNNISDRIAVVFDGMEATNQEVRELMKLIRESNKYSKRIQDLPAAIEALKKAQEHLKNRIRVLDQPSPIINSFIREVNTKLSRACLPCFGLETEEEEEEEEDTSGGMLTRKRSLPLKIPYSGEELEQIPMTGPPHRGEMSFRDWLKECDPSNQDWEILSGLRDRAVVLGTRLFHLLVEFMLLIPEGEREFFMEKTRKYSLEPEEEENAVVVNKMRSLLDGIMSESSKLKKNKGKKAEEGDERKWEKFCDEMGQKLLIKVTELENFLSFPTLPELSINLSKEILVELGQNYDTLESELGLISRQMSEKSSSLGLLGDNLSEMSTLRKELELKIEQLWQGFGSEEIDDD